MLENGQVLFLIEPDKGTASPCLLVVGPVRVDLAIAFEHVEQALLVLS